MATIGKFVVHELFGIGIGNVEIDALGRRVCKLG
jgi:hypothetical protein